jgi:hypothetical protein
MKALTSTELSSTALTMLASHIMDNIGYVPGKLIN